MTMLMEPRDAAQLTCLRVVDGFELENLTRRGWKVVETIFTSEAVDIFVPMSDEEARARGQQFGGATYFDGVGQVPYGMRRSKTMGTVCKFLIGQSGETALEHLQTELEAARHKCAQAEREVADALSIAKKAEEESARLQKSHEVCSADRDRFHGEVGTIQAQKRKLEVDIGKLRTALGDLRMKEILEGAGK